MYEFKNPYFYFYDTDYHGCTYNNNWHSITYSLPSSGFHNELTVTVGDFVILNDSFVVLRTLILLLPHIRMDVVLIVILLQIVLVILER